MSRTTKTITALIVTLFSFTSFAAETTLTWDPTEDPNLQGYRLFVGTSSGNYSSHYDLGVVNAYTVQGLARGQTYYFNLKALAADSNLNSDFAGEVSEYQPDPPTAEFTASVVSGEAPLTVTFTDHSTGVFNNRHWDFGNGTTSSAAVASLSYTQAGTYTVKLTVSGPDGADTLTRTGMITVVEPPPPPPPENDQQTDFSIEIDEIVIDEQWQWVEFTETFFDPVVVAGPIHENATYPGVVRIRNVDASGFEVRLQPWDYLEGASHQTTTTFMAVEKGIHLLPNGGQLEAGTTWAPGNGRSKSRQLGEAFDSTPVIFATVVSNREHDAVIPRIRRITTKSFQLSLQEQEANPQYHKRERVSYIAWEPSAGTFNGWNYEVATTPKAVDHNNYFVFAIAPFKDVPNVLASSQNSDSPDPAVVEWTYANEFGIQLRLREEQSHDQEVQHNAQSVGYILLSPAH